MPKTKFAQLASMSTIFVDAEDMASVIKFKPQEATVSAKFVLNEMKSPQYRHLVQDAVYYGQQWKGKDGLERSHEKLLVNFGIEILKYVSGRVSVEVEPRLSFKPKRTKNRARRMAELFKKENVSLDRVLFKIAATWQGLCAAEDLEKDGIYCNMALVFNEPGQAKACGDEKITQVSVGVGGITDWYKKNNKSISVTKDAAAKVVKAIDAYYSKHGHKTIIRAQGFQTEEQVLSLGGCDQLAIAVELLPGLQHGYGTITSQLTASKENNKVKKPLDDRHFYMRLCRDAVVIEKLHEGIRNMVADWKAYDKALKKQSKL